MSNFVITYNISNDDSRDTLKKAIEKLGIPEQPDNQTTHYGRYSNYASLQVKLLIIFQKLTFSSKDFVTVYKTAINAGACDIDHVKLVIRGKVMIKQ